MEQLEIKIERCVLKPDPINACTHNVWNCSWQQFEGYHYSCYGLTTNKWRITRQDKTRYDNTRELRVLLIHQLVLVYWKAVPQTISFYNPEPY
jgi:hypothetical protein